MRSPLLRSACVALAVVACAHGLCAQTPPPALVLPETSPAATFKQRVGVTDIEVVYWRPALRGRSAFGALAPFGSVWRTGANSATLITFSTDVTIQGAALAAAEASLAGAAQASGELKEEYTRLNHDLIASLK